jgi:opacity protein-like surface antigen
LLAPALRRRSLGCADRRTKQMVRVTCFIAAAAATVFATMASAADMPMPPPPQIPMQPIPMIVEQPFGAWYLRGDIGVGVLTYQSFNFTQTNSNFVWPASWTIVQQSIQDTTIFGFGVGYEFNSWLRFDVTGEYRTKAAFRTTGSYTNFCAGGGTCFDINTGNYSASVFMANVYLDLGTWWCLTPFIGAGIGGAYNTISGVQDAGVNSDGTAGYSYGDNSSLSLAWNVQAGVTYNVNNNLKIDLSWRYLNLGSPVTAVVQCQNTPSCPGAYYSLHDMTSQDFRVGFRWLLLPDAGAGVMAQPVMAAPVQQYAPMPPPQYMPMQPPLSSRG